MEITRENTGELTATVKVTLAPEDYSGQVTKVLKDYQRKANVPGFRPGHVPYGMIRRMYGPAVFADEVNKLVSDALNNYLKEEKLDILGQPLPNMDLTPTFDWMEEKDIQFYFDLGLTPAFDLELNDSIAIDYHKIKVNDELLDRYITDIRQRFGSLGSVDFSGEKDVLTCEFTELDAEGNPLENGITNTSKLMIDTIRDEEIKNSFIGLKRGDVVMFNPAKAAGNASETASLLGISREKAEGLTSDFSCNVIEISTMVPAEINQELYDKVFPGADIQDEAGFRERIRTESETSFIADSDHLFMHYAQDRILELVPMNLPDAFMKRWLIESNEGKLNEETLEKEYDKYTLSMKWQLIENRLIKDFDIQLGDEEIKDQVKDRYLPGWRTMPLTDDLKARLESLAESFLESRQDETRRLIDSLYEKKLSDLIKSKVTLVEKEISYEDFIKLDGERH